MASSLNEVIKKLLRSDMSRLKDDHIIVLDLTIPRTPQELRQAYIDTLDGIGKVSSLGGANVGGIESTVDILSVIEFPNRLDLYSDFSLVFILRIFYMIDGVRTQFDFAITKADVYLFAYKVGTGNWKHCSGIRNEVKDSEPSGFSVSYIDSETNFTSLLGLSRIMQALDGLNRGGQQKSAWFHTLCIHFAEPVRFNNIRNEILPYIESDDMTGEISAQSRRCINNWSDFSDAWRKLVYKDKLEVPEKLRMCMPMIYRAHGESDRKFQNRIKEQLELWIQENVLLLKSEKSNMRLERIRFKIPKLINPSRTTAPVAHIQHKQDLENARSLFWEQRIQQANGDLLRFGTLKTLQQITKIVSINKKMAQLMIDHSCIILSDQNLVTCKDLSGRTYNLGEFLFANPRNIKLNR